MKLVLCMLGYNEGSMLPYSLGSVYDEVDSVLFVEGGVVGRTPTPHSTDGTIDLLMSMDKDKKVKLIQTPDDEWWSSYEENKNEFMKNTEVNDWLVIADCDEVYRSGDLTKLRRIIDARPQYFDIAPVFIEFYRDFKHILPPGVINPVHQRVLRKSESGEHFSCHHPTSCIHGHLDSRLDRQFEDRMILIPDFNIFHLSWIKPIEFMHAKHKYYAMAFDHVDEVEADKRAEDHIARIGSRLLSYDGDIPEILHTHPLYGKDVVGGVYPHWKSTMEYYSPESIPILYNLDWVKPPKVSVVITCYKNLDVLRKTLPMWGQVRYSDFEVVIVEDGESEGIVTGIKEYVESLSTDRLQYRYYHNDSGSSYCISSARNIGIWNSTGSRIIFTDSDCIPSIYFISEHIVNYDSNNITVGPRYHIKPEDIVDSTDIEHIKSKVCDTDPRIEKDFKQIDKGTNLSPWESVWGCNFSVDRKQLIDINGLDEEYDGAWGAEDVDVAFRLIRKGLKVKPVPKSIGYHIDHPSLERQGQRDKLNAKMQQDIVRARPKSWV